jgi:hypothetical protein
VKDKNYSAAVQAAVENLKGGDNDEPAQMFEESLRVSDLLHAAIVVYTC